MQSARSTGKAAALLMKAGKYQKASHTLDTALKSGVSLPTMHLQLADCYLEMENYEEAVGPPWLMPPRHVHLFSRRALSGSIQKQIPKRIANGLARLVPMRCKYRVI